MLKTDGEHIVHYPVHPGKFEFDAEVSRIFPDMARRAIPMYDEAHRLHVSMLRNIFLQQRVVVCDIGASRGNFFREICNQFQIPVAEGSPNFEFIAVDSSPHMLHLLHDEMPWVGTVVADARHMVDFEEPADIICLFYILQFIEDDKEKLSVLRWAYRNLRPGGILLLGQKVEITDTYDTCFTSEYHKFRLRNGYSQEEIDAKSKALRNSMWPSTPAWLESMCYSAGFIDYVETTKWLQFSTSMCTR